MPLDTVGLADLSRVGGKAAHLGILIAAGVHVPPGFVVTTRAFKRFMQSDARITKWLTKLSACDAEDLAALRTAAHELRTQMDSIVVPNDVAEAIAAAISLAPAQAWAVRSSGTVEDSPDASFAGQHDSFLNVRGTEAIVAAVKRCWLSLFSDRAISYRNRKGIAPDHAQMAVIVQRLIDADAAGVMFTANPAADNSDSILVEAAFGLGEALVQGKVAPDRIEVSRSSLRVARPEAGTVIARVLDDDVVVRLARLGLETERILGCPLDIEWCVRAGEIWLLQARAVTARRHPREASFEDRQVWTNANTGEVLPDVVTPMTWSLIRVFGHDLFDTWLRACGVRIEQDQLFGLVAGRAYFNFNTICALGRRLPGLRTQTLESLLGGHQDALVALQRIKLSDADLPLIEISRWRTVLRAPPIVLGFLLHSSRASHAAVENLQRENEHLAGMEPSQLSDDDLVAAIGTTFMPGKLLELGAVDALGFATVDYGVFFGVCGRWFGSDGQGIANRLLAGVGEMEDVVAGHDLWRLAERAAGEPEIRSALLAERTFPGFAARLADCRGGSAFLAQWNAFMRRHGHHTRGEIELFNPRWSECPEFVLNMVRGYVEGIDDGRDGPIARHEALAEERLALERKCLGTLRNPVKRALFRVCLRRAQQGGRTRENLKSEMIRWLSFLRCLLLEFGRRLVVRGRLAEATDVFFLEIREFQDGSVSEPARDLRALVATRRTEYERNRELSPPAVIVGRFDERKHVPEPVDRAKNVFHGLGVSAGKVRGRARVILRSDAGERLQPGEILVAPFTDPGWTLYFAAAAGIVMDLGGLLSHGSIVAREYGIPAVVNVGAATQIIQTGQWLEVDADRGVVTVLDQPDAFAVQVDAFVKQ